MPGHDIIVLGASAGGVEALTHLVRDLPPELPAPERIAQASVPGTSGACKEDTACYDPEVRPGGARTGSSGGRLDYRQGARHAPSPGIRGKRDHDRST